MTILFGFLLFFSCAASYRDRQL